MSGSSNLPVYMDYSATTPVDARVVEKMIPFLSVDFGNPASRHHAYGWKSEIAVEAARQSVASLVNCEPGEIYWTSGATEANNLAIKSVAECLESQGKHVITVSTEHKAVLDACRYLERRGFSVTYLRPKDDGLITLDQVSEAIRSDTILVSVMLVNNEIGVIQDIAGIGALCRKRGIVFHSDAAQATGKVSIDLQEWEVDLMTFTAHKTYGPKGIGALYVRRHLGFCLGAQIHGGGHERGLRSGTLPTHQIVGMGEAFSIAQAEMAVEVARIRSLQERLYSGLKSISGAHLNGGLDCRVPHNLNFSFSEVDGESLMMAMSGLAVSTGSACTSMNLEPSYVVTAMGRSFELAKGAIRFSIGRFTTVDEVDYAISEVNYKVAKLRRF